MASSHSHWHHYIARMQQRPFTDDAQRTHVWVYDKTTGGISRETIGSVAARTDFYTVTLAGGDTHDNLERTFAQAESKAAPALARLRDAPVGPLALTDNERSRLAIIAAMTHARVPAQVDGAIELAAQIARWHLLALTHNAPGFAQTAHAAGLAGTDVELEQQRHRIREQLDHGDLHITASVEFGLLAMAQELICAPAILYPRRMFVLRHEGDEQFLLSDNPSVLQAPAHGPVGYLTSGVRLLLPFSPCCALVIADAAGESAVEAADAATTREISDWVWRQAVRFVIAPSAHALEAGAARLGAYAQTPGGRLQFG